MIFHPSITQEVHEHNIRRYNLALGRLADTRERDAAQMAEPLSQSLADVPDAELEWIWPGRLPAGELSLVVGETGAGKSLVVADRVSSGLGGPEGAEPKPPGGVLLISPHVEWQSLVRPRLLAAGSDAGRITLISDVVERRGVRNDPFHVRFDLRTGGKLLESILDDVDHPRLIVVDPFSAFVTLAPPLRGLEQTELRRLLDRLRQIAADRELAIVCTETFPGGVLLDRIGHPRRVAAGVDAAFQSVWGVVRDPEDRCGRLFLPVRHHLGDDHRGVRFRIEPVEGNAAVIDWGDPEETLTFSAAVMAELSLPGTRLHTKTACAKRWVREFLKDGPQPSKEIFAASKEVGLTETPLASALRAVAIKSKQGQSGPWVWELRENDRKSRD